MIKIRLFFTLLVFMLIFSSCKKKTLETHQDYIVSGNTAPPYSGITTVQIENYITRMYIDALGETPNSSQLAVHVNYLKQNNLDTNSREEIVDLLISDARFYQKLFQTISVKMLEGVTDVDINNQIAELDYIVQFLYSTQDTLSAQYVEYQAQSIRDLRDVDSLFSIGQVSVNQLYETVCNNYFYDEINMGSENFVISCFENLFNRAPSTAEKQNGISMVDGEPKILLLKDGDSRLDFLNIVTTVDEFYQGLITEAYQRFLSRIPNSIEVDYHLNLLKQDNSLENMHKRILITNEYAGF